MDVRRLLLLAAITAVTGLLLPAAKDRASLASYAFLHDRDAVKESHRFWIRDGNPPASARHDSGVESVPFAELKTVLSNALQKHKHEPAPSIDEADWIIVVFRGRTNGTYWIVNPPDPINPGANETVLVDVPYSAATSDVQAPRQPSFSNPEAHVAGKRPISRLAATLGYRDLFTTTPQTQAQPHNKEKISRMFDELRKDRFYILAAAYDWKAMQADDHEHLVWETRLSLEAKDRNFSRCYEAMIKGGTRFLTKSTRGSLNRTGVVIPTPSP